ncbi:MAG TPA: hypothetical protein PLV02_08085 [Candidatus Mcinerneyibacteriales bacterium]|nr:hypothetical protein [Candidatus Mcinerneyibacteriales bacterium]
MEKRIEIRGVNCNESRDARVLIERVIEAFETSSEADYAYRHRESPVYRLTLFSAEEMSSGPFLFYALTLTRWNGQDLPHFVHSGLGFCHKEEVKEGVGKICSVVTKAMQVFEEYYGNVRDGGESISLSGDGREM